MMTIVSALRRALGASLVAALASAHAAGAQQIDVHASYIHGRDEQQPLTGFGVGARKTFAIPYLYLGVHVGVDYAREHRLGPGRSAAALDLTLTPGIEELRFLPYVGGSVSANRSGGQQPAWNGTRTGFDGLVGAIFPGGRFGLQLEARYGYIEQLPHVFAGRVGLIAAL
jgi:hypothetical protein